MRPLLLCMAALLAVPATASAQETRKVVPAHDPLHLEWLSLEISGAPLGISVVSGLRKWVGERYQLGVRGMVSQVAVVEDLNGDGTTDFSRSLENNPRHFEVQGDLTWSFRVRRDHVSFGSGLRLGRPKMLDDKHLVEWTHTDAVERITDTSLALGVRTALGGSEVQVGLPVGVRLGQRLRTAGKRFHERWVQGRVVVFPQGPTAGIDFEAAYIRALYGLSLHFVYFPKIGDTDPAGPTCSFAPQKCEPATPVTNFNRIPDQGMWQLSVRIRVAYIR